MSANTITPHVVSFVCSVCKKQYDFMSNNLSAGYAVDRDGNKVCYTCCAEADKKEMIETGKKWDLYLTETSGFKDWWKSTGVGVVSNWPGSLKFPAVVVRTRHNYGFARIFHTAYFIGPDGKVWIGRQAGNYSELCHCKTNVKNPSWTAPEIKGLISRMTNFFPHEMAGEMIDQHIKEYNERHAGGK